MRERVFLVMNELTKLLKVEFPVIQAPMAGGVTTSQLVAAVSNCGGLGMIGAGYLTPTQMRDQIKEIKQLTSKPFGVNLFIPNEYAVSSDLIDKAISSLQPFHQQLNTDAEQRHIQKSEALYKNFDEQLQVVLDEEVPICSFTFGLPSIEVIDILKKAKITLIGTATSVKEALLNESSGMDIVTVQGCEAGGHRGAFSDDGEGGLIGLMSLIPQVVDRLQIPVIAAGGIMDSRGVKASLCLGAKGVQMGTAFLTCKESGAHSLHKDAILHSSEEDIILTRAFSGKWARGIKNTFTTEMDRDGVFIADFPVQNNLTKGIRKEASIQNNRNYMSLWSGQNPRMAKQQKVEDLMKEVTTVFE